MSRLDHLVDAADLPALLRDLTGLPLTTLGEKGGTILDPRPGHEECDPSFSVYRNLRGTWMWRRRGDDDQTGTAFHLLLALGYSAQDAVERLQQLTGLTARDAPRPWTAARPAPPSALTRAREHQPKRPQPKDTRYARQHLTPIQLGSATHADLARRGLQHSHVLHAQELRGELAFPLTRPFGSLLNVKVRHHGEGTRYSYRLAGLGSPAWVNPDYGDAPLLLIVEGELNAVAAFEAASACGRALDVQGLPGADTWPLLSGLQRDVRVYTDGDAGGDACWARLHDLLHEAGATSVTRLPPLVGQDYCDVLGQRGAQVLNALLDPPPGCPPVGPNPTLTPDRTSVLGEWPLIQTCTGGHWFTRKQTMT